MAKKRSTTRNQNHGDDASSSKEFKTCDKIGVSAWSDLNHDVLFLVMTQLGVIDFVAFNGVCKSWRSFALLHRDGFMASRPPMLVIRVTDRPYKKECYLEDFERRKFKTLLPHSDSGGRTFIGLTCGYLIFYEEKIREFCLVNPITRYELHFPNFPTCSHLNPIEAILVFSPLTSAWVLVVFRKDSNTILLSTSGTGFWSHVTSTFSIHDLHAFNGKIYALHFSFNGCCRLSELRLNPKPKLILLEIKNNPKPDFWCPKFVSSGENLYVVDHISHVPNNVYELNLGKMELVSLKEKAELEHVFFLSVSFGVVINGAAIKPESWAVDPRSKYKRYDCFPYTPYENRKERFFVTSMWYFPHECINVNLIYE